MPVPCMKILFQGNLSSNICSFKLTKLGQAEISSLGSGECSFIFYICFRSIRMNVATRWLDWSTHSKQCLTLGRISFTNCVSEAFSHFSMGHHQRPQNQTFSKFSHKFGKTMFEMVYSQPCLLVRWTALTTFSSTEGSCGQLQHFFRYPPASKLCSQMWESATAKLEILEMEISVPLYPMYG